MFLLDALRLSGLSVADSIPRKAAGIEVLARFRVPMHFHARKCAGNAAHLVTGPTQRTPSVTMSKTPDDDVKWWALSQLHRHTLDATEYSEQCWAKISLPNNTLDARQSTGNNVRREFLNLLFRIIVSSCSATVPESPVLGLKPGKSQYSRLPAILTCHSCASGLERNDTRRGDKALVQ